MNPVIKTALTIIVATVIVIGANAALTPSSTTKALNENPAYFPVLLIHGLGEQAGEMAFNRLEEHLESMFFDVEVMDFNKIKNKKILNDKKHGSLGALGALVGKQISKMQKDYNSAKVNVIANSYGGLIVEAYMLGFSEEFDKKKGKFENSIHKVVYVNTPFYGSNADEELLEQLCQETDYGDYTDWKEMLETLKPGSEWIYKLDHERRIQDIYDGNVDAFTFVASNDIVVDNKYSTLHPFMANDVFKRFRVMLDPKYVHCSNALAENAADGADESANQRSLAWVAGITSNNFFAYASFLDDGNTWKKIGSVDLDPNAIILFKPDPDANKSTFDAEANVKFILQKKADVSNRKLLRKIYGYNGDKIKNGYVYKLEKNEDSGVYYIYDMVPGTYQLKITNPGLDGVDIEQEVGLYGRRGYDFDTKDNRLTLGNKNLSSTLRGLFTLESAKFTQAYEDVASELVPKLNVHGFYIEFTIEGAAYDLYAGNPNGPKYGFNKGQTVSIYNGNIGQRKSNGSRFETWLRGAHLPDAPNPGAGGKKGEITVLVSHDKNQNGDFDKDERHEIKPSKTWNWREQHTIKLTCETLANGNSKVKLYVDGILIDSIERSKAYYNPNPRVVVGGYYEDWKYRNPVGAVISNVVVDNLSN